MTGSVKVVLFRSKTLSNGEHPVMLRVTKNRKQRYVSLGFSCPAKLWDDKVGRPKRSHPLYKEWVRQLDEQETTARRELINAVSERKNFAVQDVLDAAVYKPKADRLLIGFFNQVIDRLKGAGRIGYAATFTDTRNNLVNTMGREELEFAELTPAFLIKWENLLLGKGLKKTSISLYFRTLRVLVGYARKEGVVKRSFNPFEDFKLTKYQRIQTPKRSITVQDVQRLAAVRTVPGSEEFHAQQLFLFTYYCRGINFTDVARLTRESVYTTHEGEFRLRYSRQKTDHPFDIGLLKPARTIWLYYLNNQLVHNKYVWPILNSEIHQQPQQIDWRMHRVNRDWNRALRRVGELAGIGQYLTLYVARHTFATAMKNAGTSVSVISEMMGHDSEQTTRIYLRQFPQHVLDEAARFLLPPSPALAPSKPDDQEPSTPEDLTNNQEPPVSKTSGPASPGV